MLSDKLTKKECMRKIVYVLMYFHANIKSAIYLG